MAKPTQAWEQNPAIHDFRNFLYLVWEFLGLPEPTPAQYEMAEFLQHGPRRLVIQAFRGVGKSWITSTFVVWHLLRDPGANILVVSASKDRADQFSVFTMGLIKGMPLLTELIPRPGQRDSKIQFDVGPAGISHSPSVTSKGITGQLTGSRADIIVADDVESRNNSETQMMKEKLRENMKEFDAIIKPKVGRILILGTPQTEESVYNTLSPEVFETRVWPARYPLPSKIPGYGTRLAPSILEKAEECPWEPTDPKRFDEEELAAREMSYGKTGFLLQFMLDQSLSDEERYPLKLRDLVIAPVDITDGPHRVMAGATNDLIQHDLPLVGFRSDKYYGAAFYSKEPSERSPYDSRVLAVDPAGRGSDETGIAVAYSLNGIIHIPFVKGVQGGYSAEVLQLIADTAEKYKVHKVIVEANFGDGMFTELLKPYLTRTYPVSVEEVKHNTQKERRIADVLEPVMNQRRLVVDPQVVIDDYNSTNGYPLEKQNDYRLFYQMTRLTRERDCLKNDDRLDSLAMAVQYHVKTAGLDTESQASRKEQARMDAILEAIGRGEPAFRRRNPRRKPRSWRDDRASSYRQ